MAQLRHAPTIESELAVVDLGDERLERRLLRVAGRVAASPSTSFPKVCGSEGELEGLYRFLSNERVQWQSVLAPHFARTAIRCQQAGRVVVIHDSSEFTFRSETGAREDLGYLPHGHRGFRGHVALAATIGAAPVPLGLLGFEPVIRPKPSGRNHGENVRLSNAKDIADKESRRWERVALEVESRLNDVAAIHVMDREADTFPLLKTLSGEGHDFVVRGRWNRGVVDPEEGLIVVSDVLEELEGELLRTLDIEARKANPTKHKSEREQRTATLMVRAARVKMLQARKQSAEFVEVNVVEVFEKSPPKGDEPLHWRLYTTLPITTLEDLALVVDVYRQRWLVEEFFKALKTGCSYERRQLMSMHGLLNTFALLAPMAWRILLLRSLARQAPEAPASSVIAEEELLLLRRLSVRVRLSDTPTADETLRAIAGLGGHLKRNGPPGWQTIWSGFEELLKAKRGWDAARSDQS